MHVTDLMDVDGDDEVGTPDHALVRCECGTIHRPGDATHAEVCDR